MAASAEISDEALAWTAEWCFRPETLEAASAAIVNYHHRLPFAQVSGRPGLKRRPVVGGLINEYERAA
jgi:TnpA family transposase